MKRKSIPLIIFCVVVAFLVLFVLYTGRNVPEPPKDSTINSIIIQKDGKTLTVSADGTARLESKDGISDAFWSKDKVNAFLSYFGTKDSESGELITGGENYITISTGSGSNTYPLNDDDDEFVDVVNDDVSSGGGGGGGGGIGDIIGGHSPTPLPTGTNAGGGGGGGGDTTCLYWTLSFCVRLRTPTPSPVATTTTVEIREPSCDANTQTGKTVIGNDLCLPTPSPTPTSTP